MSPRRRTRPRADPPADIMDNKRVIIAVVLSMLVLIGWNFIFPPEPVQRIEPQPGNVTQENVAPAQTAQQQTPAEIESRPLDIVEGKYITVKTPLYTAVFNSHGGILQQFTLHKYQESIEPDSPDVDLVGTASTRGPMGLLLNRKATWNIGSWGAATDIEGNPVSNFDLSGEESAQLVFTGEVDGVRIKRVLTFDPATYLVREQVSLVNPMEQAIGGNLRFTLASNSLTRDDDRYNMTRVSAFTPSGLEKESDTDDLAAEGMIIDNGVIWAGIQSNYFLLAVTPDEEQTQGDGAGFLAKMDDNVYRVALERKLGNLAPNSETLVNANYYLGPKSEDAMADTPNQLSEAISYGWFDIIAKPLLVALNVFYKYVGNYGVAIILLTIVIKILFWPLSNKSYKSMNQMKKLQPMMAKIREKYKDDKQKMQQEMMNLYKTYKVNPAGGCLPMVLQIPVFIGLYQALLNSIQLRHAPFISHVPFTDIIWLADLSAKDPFYITPLVMGGTMFLQQKMTPQPGDPTQAKIMMFMPLIFTFIFLNFPAGLVIYWLTNNIISIAQQRWMLKKA